MNEIQFEGEAFKIIDGFKNYAVSKSGKVLSIRKKIVLKQQKINSGYFVTRLTSNEGVSKMRTIHRLVAICWLIPVGGKEFVNHMDHNKTNNNVSNLEWTTRSENVKHSFLNDKSQNRRQKARERMSLIGKKYAEKNSDNLRKLNIKMRVPIIQYDLDGNFIARFESGTQALKMTGIRNITAALDGKYKQAGGYIWKRERDCSTQ